MCRALKRIELYVNGLFYDPTFSTALVYSPESQPNIATITSTKEPATQQRTNLYHNGSNLGLETGENPNTTNTRNNSGVHADFYSTIDELFGEQIDDQPLEASDLKAGIIMTHISLVILKAVIKYSTTITTTTTTMNSSSISHTVIDQIIVYAVFAKLLMCRYAGIPP